MDMNTDTSSMYTIPEEVLTHNLEEGELIDMPCQVTLTAEWDIFLFKETWKIGKNVTSITTKHTNLKESVGKSITDNKPQ